MNEELKLKSFFKETLHTNIENFFTLSILNHSKKYQFSHNHGYEGLIDLLKDITSNYFENKHKLLNLNFTTSQSLPASLGIKSTEFNSYEISFTRTYNNNQFCISIYKESVKSINLHLKKLNVDGHIYLDMNNEPDLNKIPKDADFQEHFIFSINNVSNPVFVPFLITEIISFQTLFFNNSVAYIFSKADEILTKEYIYDKLLQQSLLANPKYLSDHYKEISNNADSKNFFKDTSLWLTLN